ncbi:hypothetical protein KFK09_004601 [Dendrobium nobile]|uniref:Uncharacterized protein n=1 Tax=Dendrobium nobile TaxID=94219 RepID=A0A8T3C144_DENNO|nr:hypothetical protein KFK09_004601 [Dendrobium nobile]
MISNCQTDYVVVIKASNLPKSPSESNWKKTVKSDDHHPKLTRDGVKTTSDLKTELDVVLGNRQY